MPPKKKLRSPGRRRPPPPQPLQQQQQESETQHCRSGGHTSDGETIVADDGGVGEPVSPMFVKEETMQDGQGPEIDSHEFTHEDSALFQGSDESTQVSRKQSFSGSRPTTPYSGADKMTAENDGAADGHAKAEPGSDYPPLQSSPSNGNHKTGAWTAGGVRFAPVHIPLSRRLQTSAVLFHCVTFATLLASFFLLCSNPFLWPVIIIYLVYISMSTSATDGKLSLRSETLRSLPLWKFFASYFPMRLHKTHDLPPTEKYIFGYHPHGIISHGAWAAFGTNALGFSKLFPGITNSLLTLDSNFRVPLYREWISAMGLASVSRESITNLLTKGGSDGKGTGRAVTIVIGGARESLEARPGHTRLILNERKGFVKLAIRLGADLVPIFAFGENDIYDQLDPNEHPVVHRFQQLILKWLKFTLPAVHGRGVLNYDVGLMPYRRPVNIVIGKPIKVTKSPEGGNPSQEEIDELHAQYVAELQRIWDTYKDQFAPYRKEELCFIG